MNVTTPPTDNLYKFMAISGLIIFLLSLYFPFKQAEDLELRISKVAGEIDEYNIKWEELYQQWLEVDNEFREGFRKEFGDSIYDEFIKLYEEREYFACRDFLLRLTEKVQYSVIIPNKEDTSKVFNRTVRTLKLKEELIQHRITLSRIDTKNRELKILFNWRKRWNFLILTGGLIGAVISILGFILWYWRLQKPQDLILKNKLRKAGTLEK